MDLEMVFNELSLQTPAKDIYAARQWMSMLIQTIVLATGQFGVKRVLRIEKEIFHWPLVSEPHYSIHLWRNDKQVDREEKQFFRNLLTKYPALIGFEETEIGETYMLFDFRCEGDRVHGLGVAYLLKALALSLNSHLRWDKHEISLQIPDMIIVPHAGQPKHIRANAEWIKKRLEQGNPWLKNGLPQNGECPYFPPKIYYREGLDDFPTKLYGSNKVFIDYKNRLWLWDKQEKHWDVQIEPYGQGDYFRVTPDGRLLDSGKGH